MLAPPDVGLRSGQLTPLTCGVDPPAFECADGDQVQFLPVGRGPDQRQAEHDAADRARFADQPVGAVSRAGLRPGAPRAERRDRTGPTARWRWRLGSLCNELRLRSGGAKDAAVHRMKARTELVGDFEDIHRLTANVEGAG